MVPLFLVFKVPPNSVLDVPIYVPTNSIGGFPSLYTLSSIYYLIDFFELAILTGMR